MSGFFQALEDAFPVLKTHPLLMARLLVATLVVVAIYAAKGPRSRICNWLLSRLYDRLVSQLRWLYVHRDSNNLDEWKYYTSETTGKVGDDIIWTLVDWPNLKPKDSFRVAGAVGMLDGVHESQIKLKARWEIVHDPDGGGLVGCVPAHGVINGFCRAMHKLLTAVASI